MQNNNYYFFELFHRSLIKIRERGKRYTAHKISTKLRGQHILFKNKNADNKYSIEARHRQINLLDFKQSCDFDFDYDI